MARVVLLFFVFLLPLLLWGQDEERLPEDYQLQLKVSASAPLTPNYPGLLAGLEYPLASELTVAHEGGVFASFGSALSENDYKVRGFKVRTGLRWYPSGRFQNRANFYMSLQFQYKRERHQYTFFIDRFGGAYQELYYVTELKKYFGGFFLTGWQGTLSPNSRWEVDLGAGLRQRWNQFTDLPADAIPLSSIDRFNVGEFFEWPALFVAFTLDVRFNFIIR